jgi:hypothetical protein
MAERKHFISKHQLRRKLVLLDRFIEEPSWQAWQLFSNHSKYNICDIPKGMAKPFDPAIGCLDCPLCKYPEGMNFCHIRYFFSTYKEHEAEILVRAIEFRTRIRYAMKVSP